MSAPRTYEDLLSIGQKAVGDADIDARKLYANLLIGEIVQARHFESCWREALVMERSLVANLKAQLELAHVEIERSEKERDAMKLPPGERYVLRVVKP